MGPDWNCYTMWLCVMTVRQRTLYYHQAQMVLDYGRISGHIGAELLMDQRAHRC